MIFGEQLPLISLNSGSSINPDRYLPHSIELKIELLVAEEERYYPDEMDQERMERWKRTVERDNSHKLAGWRAYITRWQSDFGAFSLEDTLSRIERCMRELGRLVKAGSRRQGAVRPEAGTEQFAADLLVHRMKLMWMCGRRKEAVKLVQMLAEWYFFAPEDMVSGVGVCRPRSVMATGGAKRMGG